MAVSVLYDPLTRHGCLVSTSTGSVFGPVFEDVDDVRQIEAFVEWLLRAGVDPREEHDEGLRASFSQFVVESAVETKVAFRCEHCERTLAAHEIHSVQTGVVAGENAYATPCPRCGRGDGDFAEIEICAACGKVCETRAAHVGCATAARAVVRERKPPARSVRAPSCRLKEA